MAADAAAGAGLGISVQPLPPVSDVKPAAPAARPQSACNRFLRGKWCGVSAFTYGTIFVCLAVFGSEMRHGFAPFRDNVMLGPDLDTLLASGAKSTLRILHGEWWRLFTAPWLHAGIIHLVMNLAMLWRQGPHLEEDFGTLTMLAIFIVSGVFSMLASAVFVPGYITVGASGAEFGLLGALIADVCVNWHEGSWRESASRLASIITNVGLNLALGLMVPFVDNWAHCGGLLCGLLIGGMLLSRGSVFAAGSGHESPRSKCLRAGSQRAIAMVCSATLAVLFMALAIGLGRTDDALAFCPACQYLACVPLPWRDCAAELQRASAMK